VYSTATELVRTTVDGAQSWRRTLGLATFEISANGQSLSGVLSAPGNAQVVHVNLTTGVVGSPVVLDSAFWNVAVAPGGRFSVATTKTAAYLFDGGTLAKRTDLPVAWTVSADVSDQGFVALGAQLAAHEGQLLFLGPSGGGITRVTRPVEANGYRPHVKFFANGQKLLVNESSGLTTFDIGQVP
jgi:hypothetical protein